MVRIILKKEVDAESVIKAKKKKADGQPDCCSELYTCPASHKSRIACITVHAHVMYAWM